MKPRTLVTLLERPLRPCTCRACTKPRPNPYLKRLEAALNSGELQEAYERAQAEGAKLRAELEASRHVDPAVLNLRVTI